MIATLRGVAWAGVVWIRRDNTSAPAGRDALTGTPARSRLVLLSVTLAILLAGITLVALPGSPKDPGKGIASLPDYPAVVASIVALITVGGLWAWRTWTYRRLLRLPGPIQVLELRHAGEAPDGMPPPDISAARTRLDAHFRHRLSEARLSAPTPKAGSTTTTDFVELLETSTLDPKQPFAVIGRLIRIVRPTHAYEVRATLVEREQTPSYGVVTELVILPHRRTTLHTYWHADWESALDRAAVGITAEVVPRSRHSDRGVWSSWQGYVIDEDLFEVYERAIRLQRERRYDEALDLLFRAIPLDPGNGYIRAQVGLVQQDLALYLDALLTFEGIHSLRRHDSGSRMSRRSARRIEHFARFRRTVLLGLGEALAEQWLPAPAEAPESRRSGELRVLRARLRPMLEKQFAALTLTSEDLSLLGLDGDVREQTKVLLDERPHVDRHRDQGPDLTPQERARLRDDARRLRERRLHLLFQLLAQGSISGLVADYRRRTIRKLESQESPLTYDLLHSWAKLRTDRARHLVRAERRRQDSAERVKGLPPGTARKLRPEPLDDGWPPSIEQIHELWAPRSRFGRSLAKRLASSKKYRDHYNAACIYSIGLLPGHDQTRDGMARPAGVARRADALAEAAVRELRCLAEVGGSSALADRWHSIAADDLDLAGLRPTAAFRAFETEYLPSRQPLLSRPSSIMRLNASRNSVALCRACAQHLADVWHGRAELEGDVPIEQALAWWRDEQWAWRRAAELAAHHRHWQTRLRIIEDIQGFSQRHGATPFQSAHPSYAEDPIEGDSAEVDRLARHEIHFSDLRLAALAAALSSNGDPLPGFAAWQEYFDALDASGAPFPAAERRRLANERASAWKSLDAAFSARRTNDEHPRAIFDERFRELATRLTNLTPGEQGATSHAPAALAAVTIRNPAEPALWQRLKEWPRSRRPA